MKHRFYGGIKMAKIFKIEMYVVDTNDKTQDEQDLLDELENSLEDLLIHAANVEMRTFEWDDGIAINYVAATNEDHEAYFKEI